MSYSMRFVVTPLPASDDTLFDCIKDAATRPPRPSIPTIAQPSSSSNSATNSDLQSAATNSTNTGTSTHVNYTPSLVNNPPPSSFQSQQNNYASHQQQPQQAQDHFQNASTSATTTATTTAIVTTGSSSDDSNNNPNRTTLNAIKSVPVSQIAVGPRHVALLLEDGRVGRATYQVIADRLEFPPPTITSTSSAQFPGVSNVHYAGIALSQTQPPPYRLNVPSGAQVTTKASLNLVGNPPNIGSVITSSGMAANLDSRSTGPVGLSGSSQSSAPAPNLHPFPGRVSISPQVGSLSVQNRQVARRGRMLRHTASRGRGASVIMGSRAIIPAQYVPEDLINQAQVVLQGKPRSAIVRELQRTNLDVNSAVNNLLSSDNEDPEDLDEREDYLPNEDLMSLLDSSVGLQSGGPTSVLIDAETVFPEDVFNSYSASRIRPGSLRHTITTDRSSDRESSLASELEIRRMANRDPSQSRRWLEHALRDNSNSEGSNSRMSSATPTDFTLHHKNEFNQAPNSSVKKNSTPLEINPIQISDTIELWPGGDKRFVQIACMHSELIAVSKTGQIHQWKWSDAAPFEGVKHGEITNYHPKTAQLNLTHEKIQLISASCVRASVVTQSSKVATWVDDTISMVAGKLEHGAQGFSEFQRGDKISHLHTCSLYTCVKLESGLLYWWGVAPFSQRKKNWRKIQSKASKQCSSGTGINDIGVGSIVCLKNGPSFGDGAIGFTTKDGVPRVGRLTMSAWNITDTCTFKIIQPSDRKTSSSSHASSQSTTTEPKNQRARKILGQPLDFSSIISEDQAPQSPGISKNSSSERLEMPPPPSPASSTCSEPGCSPSQKRKNKHLISMKDEDRMRDEEQWNLKDVIFLEEVKKPPAAKVIKLDGNTALVRFNQRDPFGHQTDSDVNAYLQDCRMIRKDDLQLAKETQSSSRIIDYQRSPKRINIQDSVNFLTFTVSNNGIHALVKNGPKIEYKMYQLASGKVSKSLFFPTDPNAFLGRDPSLITLYACGENDVAVTLRDGNGSLYPLAKDFLDSLKEPQPLNMAPIQALSMAVHPIRDPSNSSKIHPTLVMAMALEDQILIPAVLRSDPAFVRLTLASLDKEPVSQQIVASEKMDLNRNVLHAAVYSCAPTPTRSQSTSERGIKFYDDSFESSQPGMSRTISGALNDSIKRSRGKHVSTSSTLDLSSESERQRTACSPGEITGSNLQAHENLSEWSDSIFNKFDIDPTEQKQPAHVVLLILVDCPILRPYLKDLMIQRDAHAMTPFMSAVSCRAYTAALILFDLALWIVKQETEIEQDQRQKLFNAMIFPYGSNLDNNPLYMLCANDTCSFTWTGAQHINQDIFECKTCGLTRSLCCCTECARTCHKGHDCRLKKTSPTAYCDCWEKCKCKSLVAGSHFTRSKLLERLLSETDLVTYPDSKGESILLFLVQTVGRQMTEQRQYGPDRSSRHNKRDDPADMPDHDLSPPRFARKALHRMLGEWLALKSVIMAGAGSSQNLGSITRMNPFLNAEDQILLSGQQGTALLDRFTHSLLIKIGAEMLDVLLTTIIREASSPNSARVSEARLVAKRFVRSVARNGVVLSVELSPINYSQQMNVLDHSNPTLNAVGISPFGANQGSGSGASTSSTSNSNLWKQSQQPASILQKCRKVFQALLPIAAEELAEIADALISPVRLGVPRPTAPFSLVNSMAEATQGSEEIFVVEPVVIPAPGANVKPEVLPVIPEAATQPRQQQTLPFGLSEPFGSSTTPSSTAVNSSVGPSINDVAPLSSDRMRDMLYDNDIVMDAIDSEDADASNNTFRRSNNGESDSDSDSNADDASFQSNLDPNGARSTATGATAGSEVGASTVAYFSEGESGDSSNGEDDEESEANDTEHDTDDRLEFPFAQEDNSSYQRRNTTSNSNTQESSSGMASQQPTQQQSPSTSLPNFRSTTNLGQQLHWALRHRDQTFYHPQSSSSSSLPSQAARLASIGLANAYSYLDGAPSRRSMMSNQVSQANNITTSTNNELSMSTTAVGLSRAFSIIIRSISDLIPILKETERLDTALTINQLKVSPTEAATIICNLEKKLNPVWEWLFKVMDSTESQLRFGCALTSGIQAASQTMVHSSSLNNPSGHSISSRNAPNIPSHGPSSFATSYFSQSGPNLPLVHPAMLARVANANLSANNLNRRFPHLTVDDPLPSRSHGPLSAATSGAPPISSHLPNMSDPPSSHVRLHNPVGQSSSNSANRPQTLPTNRGSNLLSTPGYLRVPLNDNVAPETIDGTAARRDFLSYMISLIRGHGNEHHDSLPILDVTSLRHVAYVFDAYINYLQALDRNKISKSTDEWSDDDDEELLQSNIGAKHRFFHRSESTLFLEGAAPDPFSRPISEALPLAEQPHLLQPTSRRDDLFGIPKQSVQELNLESIPLQLSLSSTLSPSCPRCMLLRQQQQLLSIGGASQDQAQVIVCPQHKRDPESKNEFQHTTLLGRWRLTVELFGREFLDDVGAEPGSILTDLVSFPMKEVRFRREMERLRNESSPREISLINVDRDKNTLIRQTIKELNSTYHLSERNQGRRNQELPFLACSKVKVSFKDEKGEGNGVARSFYTAFCEAVLSNEKLPNLDSPLFYQPGLRNFYSPRQGDATPDRLNAFRNVGRVIGICLSQSEICPIQLNRHVIKYILRKPISWHDLAFFDPILYESLRQLVLDAEATSRVPGSDVQTSLLKSLDLRFCVDLCPEESGAQQVELAANGKNIEVTPNNIYEYVRRYALKRMFKSQEKALQALRQGVMDALPPNALDNLTAEDFRLLLNGVGEINVQTLISYTSFIDDRGTSAGKRNSSVQVDEQLGYFKKWFWSIVEKMTTKERQDLVYFWTGSPSLPASEEGFQPMPTVSIRPAEDLHLPTSNVCIFRLYIPLYSSKAILRSKLLMAIKEKNFGFI